MTKKQTDTDEKVINERFIQLAFTVFISGTVAYVLKSLITYIPGRTEGAIQWIVATLFIIGAALSIIFYVLDYFPKFEDKNIWLKTILLISSTMAFLGFSRFHMFRSTLSSETTAYTEVIDWSYNSWLIFFGACGVILLFQAKILPKDNEFTIKRVVFGIIGFIVLITSILIKICISPYMTGGV